MPWVGRSAGWPRRRAAGLADAAGTAVPLACTELPLAFPEHGDAVSFRADGYTFVNATAAHAEAAFAESLAG